MRSNQSTERNLPDALILQMIRTQAAPDEAIRQLYRMQFGLTKSYIKQQSGSDEDAEDIFQEVILNFIELVKKDKFRGDSSISTFLYAMTRNTWLNELKKRGRAKARDEKFEKARDTEEMDISHYIVNRELKGMLLNLVDGLGDTCKKILVAFYFENMAMRDILNLLDYENEQVVRNKKYKCLKQLEQNISGNTQLAANLKSLLSYE
jgi:RNA polymerase sigma factor (sigma-70 family)